MRKRLNGYTTVQLVCCNQDTCKGMLRIQVYTSKVVVTSVRENKKLVKYYWDFDSKTLEELKVTYRTIYVEGEIQKEVSKEGRGWTKRLQV